LRACGPGPGLRSTPDISSSSATRIEDFDLYVVIANVTGEQVAAIVYNNNVKHGATWRMNWKFHYSLHYGSHIDIAHARDHRAYYGKT